ncbi:414d9e05-c0bc-4c03-9128-550565af3f5a [Sclerotinia trifoliorum]|uniref:414d9e05-c0bc-4c03-9128-550565af3f5a n=1 Tax=Sclerotinia trifoliorum TaxID=28548 RepID=A0A8H2W007_9HELO|nr:414d9e05-c0bc-4c03-9128-550565af3f5a [Sclerotinia trifoliorum]
MFNTTNKRWYNWYISMVAAACMVLYGYDASVFNACQNSKHWVAYFNKPSTYKIGLVNTSYNIGGIVSGFFFGGPIADRLGRRWGMGIGCLLTIIATFVQCFAPRGDLNAFIGGRVIIGLGQGIALTAGPVYIGELAPPEIRGKIMGFWQLFYSVGSFIAYWIAFATGKHTAALGEWDWKTIVIFQMLVPIIICILLPFIPETPRWYIRNGNIEGARKSLLLVRDTEQEVEDELLQIREALEYEKEQNSTGSYKALWMDKSVRKRMWIAFIINGGQQLTGQGSLNSYSSAIYKGIYKNTETINLINAINGTCGILFTLNAVWTVDRYGRKFLFIIGGFGMALCMIAFASVGIATPNEYYLNGTTRTLTKDQPVGIALTFLLFLFIFFYKPTWGATTWIWTSEIFSMNVRAQAVGMCSQWQNVSNLIFNQFFPVFLAKSSFYTFYFFGGLNCLLALFVIFVVPETRNIMLEEMDVLFGGVNHVEKGGARLDLENTNANVHVQHVESLAGKGEGEGIREVGVENVVMGEKV